MNCCDVYNSYKPTTPPGFTLGYSCDSPPLKKWKMEAVSAVSATGSPTSSDVIGVNAVPVAANVKRKFTRQDRQESQQLQQQQQQHQQQPVSTLRLSSRCVLLTYFDGDITSCIDEHFNRALRHCMTSSSGDAGVGGQSAVPSIRRPNYSTACHSEPPADRAECSFGQAANSGDLSSNVNQRMIDWSSLMTSSLCKTPSCAVNEVNSSWRHCQSTDVDTTAATDSGNSSWPSTLRFHPYYVWHRPTSSPAVQQNSRNFQSTHHGYSDLMTSSTSAYVDSYRSLLARHRPANSEECSSSGFCSADNMAVSSLGSSAAVTSSLLGGDVGDTASVRCDANWLGVGSTPVCISPTPAIGGEFSNRHVTGTSSTSDQHYFAASGDTFCGRSNGDGICQQPISNGDVYWF